MVIANYDTILCPGAGEDFFDALDREEAIEIAAGELRGSYRLSGLIGNCASPTSGPEPPTRNQQPRGP